MHARPGWRARARRRRRLGEWGKRETSFHQTSTVYVCVCSRVCILGAFPDPATHTCILISRMGGVGG